MPLSIAQTLSQAKIKLAAVIEEQASLEAEILLAHVLQQPRAYLYAWPETELNSEQDQQFQLYLDRRCHQEPIAYLTGCKAFWSLEFKVTPATLIPRPETEGLVEYVLALVANQKTKVADLGTGCGAIGLSLAHERRDWDVHLSDISAEALVVAKQNAQRFLLHHVSFKLGNWCAALSEKDFDVIVSNPPYIAGDEWQTYASSLSFEPIHALVSGQDGLQAIREIVKEAKAYLKSSGCLLIEHGFKQGKLVRDIFVAAGYSQVKSICDLAGHERITVGWRGI